MRRKDNMPKTIYVLEFSRDDSENESESFVAEVGLEYEDLERLAYQHLEKSFFASYKDVEDWDITDKVTIEGVYPVAPEFIKEVVDSYKEEK
jgi:hypothetical protein